MMEIIRSIIMSIKWRRALLLGWALLRLGLSSPAWELNLLRILMSWDYWKVVISRGSSPRIMMRQLNTQMDTRLVRLTS